MVRAGCRGGVPAQVGAPVPLLGGGGSAGLAGEQRDVRAVPALAPQLDEERALRGRGRGRPALVCERAAIVFPDVEEDDVAVDLLGGLFRDDSSEVRLPPLAFLPGGARVQPKVGAELDGLVSKIAEGFGRQADIEKVHEVQVIQTGRKNNHLLQQPEVFSNANGLELVGTRDKLVAQGVESADTM